MCNGVVATYNASASSSFQNTSAPFVIQYAEYGEETQAAGYFATETVKMAGFSVASQVIGASAAADALELTSRGIWT